MIVLAASIAPLTASGASGGGRATPVRRIAALGSPPRRWAKISSRLRFDLWGTVVPLVPAEAGGSFDGSAAISAAVGAVGGVASGAGFVFGGAASIWWRTLTSARLSPTASIVWWPPLTPRPTWPKAIARVARAAVAPIPLEDYGAVKLLFVPILVIAFLVFLLVLGAIGFAVSFAVLAALGRAWRLVSGGRSRRA